MSIGLADIMDAATSHAAATGWFDHVLPYEPKSAPGGGLTYAMWLADVRPVPRRSGLAATAACVTLQGRLYMNMLHEPQSEVDPTILSAADALLGAYTGDYELGGFVSNVDLLGAHGTGLMGRAGYLNVDGTLFRVFTITLPLVCNDLWSQSG